MTSIRPNGKHVPHGEVYVNGDTVHITHISIDDPHVRALIGTAPDPVDTVKRALSIGAQALTLITTRVDTAHVEKSFTALTEHFDTLLNRAGTTITTASTNALNDPVTGLRARLDTWSADMTRNMDRVLADAARTHEDTARRVMDHSDSTSPIYRLFTSLRDQISTVTDSVARLAEHVAADTAAAHAERNVLDRTAIKGQAYEATVVNTVTGIAATWGDETEPVGLHAGETGGKVGDIVVTIPEPTPAMPAGKYVLECKDTSVTLNHILRELRESLTNRGASAAIAVISRQDHSPLPGPFGVFGDCAIVVYDKDDPDPAALRLACSWARSHTARARHGTTVDTQSLLDITDDISRALTRRAAFRRALSTAARKLEEANGAVDDMTSEIADAMRRLTAALDVSPSGTATPPDSAVHSATDGTE